MKTMTVISLYPSIAKYYKSLLNHIFNGLLQIRSLALEEVYDNQLENTDLILVTSHIILPKVRSLNISHTDVLIMKKQISQSGLEKLKVLPTGSPVLLIGLFKELADEEIGQIYENGFHNIHFIPVYPGLSEIPRLTTAVTCGDRDWIPDSVTNLIDIYQREISLDTIFAICNRLGLDFECMKKHPTCYPVHHTV